jgi:2-iminobutanoate/2-iminopropanoate deaminase
MRTVVQAKSWPAPRFHYSPLVAAGPFLKTAGMIALDPRTGCLEEGGPGAEAAKILSILGAVMTELKLLPSSIISATLYTTEFEAFAAINAAWNSFFEGDKAPPPARTSVGVSALPLGATVEMDFLLYAPDLASSAEASTR